MTEWEQIKKEYQEIPVPADGPHQLLQTIADAKRKRNQWKRITKYGSIVAAAILVIVVLPGMLFFSQGFGGSKDMAATESAVSREESTGSADGWFNKDSAANTVGNKNMSPVLGTAAPEASLDIMADSSDSDITNESADTEYGVNVGASVEKSEGWSLLDREAISKEILRQMEKCIQEKNETYYIKSEVYPEGFELLAEGQPYYINTDGLYVIVFEAGEVAPKEQGMIEFVIPAEVALP